MRLDDLVAVSVVGLQTSCERLRVVVVVVALWWLPCVRPISQYARGS